MNQHMEGFLPERHKAYRLRRLAGDLYQRSQIGPLFYILGAALICLPDVWLRPHYGVYVPVMLLFVLMMVLRRLNKAPVDPKVGQFRRWYWSHWLLIGAGSLLWSLFAVFILSFDEGISSGAILVVYLCTIAYGSASVQAYAMDLRLNLFNIALLFAPVALWSGFTSDGWQTSLTLILFSLYLYAAAKRAAAEYKQQIQVEYDLYCSETELRRLTLVDELTGLFNRRHFHDVIEEEWPRAKRQQSAFTLAIADLDHFKLINDQYGHPVGDECLVLFSAMLRGYFTEEQAHLMRLGGEEFVLVLPGKTETQALKPIEDLIGLISRHVFHSSVGELKLSASFGIASADFNCDLNWSDTLKRADAALYQAKAAGRNRAVAAGNGVRLAH
ncbi:MAG: GGDEF domain-containing protein [Gammaproteobacteria bacterium]|nr:GGDEF domain-containing protein [Gammaproteobacteria bacterium]